MQFIKRHWFGIIISAMVFAYVSLFILILIAPKQDLQKRGFIVCTEDFINKASLCNGNLCMIKTIADNSFCDFGVITDGFISWTKGEQSTPWSNYLFEPELEQAEEGLQEVYDENPDLIYDLGKLKDLSKKLESSQNIDINVISTEELDEETESEE